MARWGAEALGKRAKQRACGDCPRRGHTLKIEGWNEMGVHGVRCGRCQIQLLHLLPHVTRNELASRLHFGHHALGLLDTRVAVISLAASPVPGGWFPHVCMPLWLLQRDG
jgi:hypothetical protein